MSEQPDGTGLSAFQVQVSELFFSLPESAGFLLAGGAALIALGMTDRTTQDLDFFTHRGAGDVNHAARALTDAANENGWEVEQIRSGREFCRLVIRGPDEVLVDLAVDTEPTRPSTVTVAGPSIAPEELAARKLLALFARAEARDYVDVHALAHIYGKADLIAEARSLDSGMEDRYLAQSYRAIGRLRVEEFPVDAASVAEIRAFFDAWAQELEPS